MVYSWYIYGVIRYIYYDIRYFYGVIRYYRYEIKEEGLDIKNFNTVSVWQYIVLYGISMTLYGIIRYIYGVIRYIRVKGDLMQLVSKIFIGCNIGIYKKLKLGGKDYDK